LESIIKASFGLVGGLASYLLGGWDALLQTLVLFIALDYVFAVIVAGTHGKLSSKISFKGIAKKVGILVLVAVSHQIDVVMSSDHIVRDTVIFFYLANELLSLLETTSKTDLPIPDALKKTVDILKNKGDGN